MIAQYTIFGFLVSSKASRFPLISTTIDDDGKKANEKEVVACLVFNVNKHFKMLSYRELKYL